jgi:hypothetical protein
MLWVASADKAETNALKAAEIDKAQLREYLKSATNLKDVAMVKKYLADLTPDPR